MVEPFGKAAHREALRWCRRLALFPADGLGDLNGRNALCIRLFQRGIGARHILKGHFGRIAAG